LKTTAMFQPTACSKFFISANGNGNRKALDVTESPWLHDVMITTVKKQCR